MVISNVFRNILVPIPPCPRLGPVWGSSPPPTSPPTGPPLPPLSPLQTKSDRLRIPSTPRCPLDPAIPPPTRPHWPPLQQANIRNTLVVRRRQIVRRPSSIVVRMSESDRQSYRLCHVPSERTTFVRFLYIPRIYIYICPYMYI